MRNTTPRWEEVHSLGLTSHEYDSLDNNLPGALTIHCYRTPHTDLKEAPFCVELENFHTGGQCAVTMTQQALLHFAHAALDAATRGLPVGQTPLEYFGDVEEGA